MTYHEKLAKELALELFTKMKGFRVKHSHSKKCAKICVDYILKNEYHPTNEAFWNDVKKEIDAL